MPSYELSKKANVVRAISLLGNSEEYFFINMKSKNKGFQFTDRCTLTTYAFLGSMFTKLRAALQHLQYMAYSGRISEHWVLLLHFRRANKCCEDYEHRIVHSVIVIHTKLRYWFPCISEIRYRGHYIQCKVHNKLKGSEV